MERHQCFFRNLLHPNAKQRFQSGEEGDGVEVNIKRLSILFITSFFLLACEEDLPQRSVLNDLEIQFLSGLIEANLGPVVPPDPIYCRIELLLINRNSEESLGGLNIPSAQVFIDSTNKLLGGFPFSTDWDGMLEPDDEDTVTLVKDSDILEERPFDPPCREFVYLELEVKNGSYEPKSFRTDSLFFTCSNGFILFFR